MAVLAKMQDDQMFTFSAEGNGLSLCGFDLDLLAIRRHSIMTRARSAVKG